MNTAQDINTANIFNITEKGDRKILTAHQNAIILVGLTRVGKSTVFNWIQKKPMVGKGKLKSFYVPIVENDSDIAPLSNSLASVTLAPNICRNFQPNLSLVDMAGYQDTRNYVGVIGVSYFLQALFEKVRKVKFVIVFDENKFKQQTCQGLIKTFQGFINMFKLHLMSPQIKERLKQSMSMVITKCEQVQNHFDYITQILEKMANPSFLFENKPLIMELLEYLRDLPRREGFEKARNSQQPKECNFIERFNGLGWKFFDLNENQKLVEQSLISLPFTKDFQRLPNQQKDKFNQQLSNKVRNYLSYAEILRRLIENFVGNWKSFISSWQKQKIFNLPSFKLTSMFEQVRQFINMNNVYELDQTVSIELKVNYVPPTLIESINSILTLQKIVQGASNIQDFEVIKRTVVDSETGEEREEEETISLTFQDVMERFKNRFAEMIKIIKTFATSQEEQLLLQKTNFILQRGFREFQKFYELDGALISDIKIKLTGNCNSVFESTQTRLPWAVNFREMFVKSLDETLLVKIFPSFQSLDKYVSFFNTFAQDRVAIAYSQSKQDEDKCFIFISELRNSIQTAKADLLLAQLQREKACLCYFDALKNINQLYKCISESYLYDEQTKSAELDKTSMRKLKLLKKIVNVLKFFEDESNQFKKYALQLANHHNMVDDTCKLFQLMIETALGAEKSSLYQQYADFCLLWAMIDKAKELLFKKLALQEDCYNKYMGVVDQLRQIQNNRVSYEQKYTTNLSIFGRLNIEDPTLDDMITTIIYQVQQVIRALEMKKDLAKQ